MSDEWIVQRAREAEKRQGFSYLVGSELSRGVNSAYGAGFIDGMVEYRNSLWHKPSEKPAEERQIIVIEKNLVIRPTWTMFYKKERTILWAYVTDLIPKDYENKTTKETT